MRVTGSACAWVSIENPVEGGGEGGDILEAAVQGSRSDPQNVGFAEVGGDPDFAQLALQRPTIAAQPQRQLRAAAFGLGWREDLATPFGEPQQQSLEVAGELLALLA